MGGHRLALAVFAFALAVVVHGAAQAAPMIPKAAATGADPLIVKVDQEGRRFHHGKRAQSVYCLRQNYWWFYRPYTTAPENFPRCEPYFHYLEPTYGRRGASAGRYAK